MENWLNRIDSTTEVFQTHYGSLTVEELNWKPNPGTWSIAQNIDHLIVINQTYFPILSELKSGSYKLPFIAKFGFMVSFFEKTVLNAVKPDRKKKMKTFPIWEPASSQISDNILEKFVEHQAELKRQIAASKVLLEKKVVISSPANKFIVYKLATAFEVIVTHEERHLAQSEEVFALMKVHVS